MNTKVAFITGASRGIGAEAAVALARRGYSVALTARTLAEGEAHDHMGDDTPMPGSLLSTAAAVEKAIAATKAETNAEVLCLRADILQPDSVVAAAHKAHKHFGRVDLLFNNAIYQGSGNLERVMEVSEEQLRAIYQGNVFTPLALIRTLLPGMEARGGGTIINMLSATAFTDPPAPADEGGWGFAYPSSKAALGRMAGSLRVEHPALRVFNLEPGTVITELMKRAGIDREILKRYKPCSPAAIGAAVAWLAENEPEAEWLEGGTLRGPAMAQALGLLDTPAALS